MLLLQSFLSWADKIIKKLRAGPASKEFVDGGINKNKSLSSPTWKLFFDLMKCSLKVAQIHRVRGKGNYSMSNILGGAVVHNSSGSESQLKDKNRVRLWHQRRGGASLGSGSKARAIFEAYSKQAPGSSFNEPNSLNTTKKDLARRLQLVQLKCLGSN